MNVEQALPVHQEGVKNVIPRCTGRVHETLMNPPLFEEALFEGAKVGDSKRILGLPIRIV